MLILTIIIMIILATAVILSLNSSGIISKAQSAKDANDKASMKEYRSVLEAEWELMAKEQREETGYSSKEEYVNAKLREKGYNVEEAEDGWLSVEEAKKVLEIGDVVEYTVTSNTEPSQAADNGYGLQNISNQTNLTWRYIGAGDDGEIMIAPDVTKDAPKLYLNGATGYLKGPEEINRLCSVLYTTDKGTARSMTIEDVNNLLGYTGEKGEYTDDYGWPVLTPEPLTLTELENNFGIEFGDYTPDGAGKGTYKSDCYNINKDDVQKMTYSDYIVYVFFGSYADSFGYWLASRCTYAVLNSSPYATFCVRCVDSSSVIGFRLCNTSGANGLCPVYALRPIVLLSFDVQLKAVSDGVWSLK